MIAVACITTTHTITPIKRRAVEIQSDVVHFVLSSQQQQEDKLSLG